MATTENVVLLERQRAVNLLAELGWKRAADWDNDRLSTKLADVASVYDDDQEISNPEIKEDLALVLAGIQDDADFAISTGEDVKIVADAGDDSGVTEDAEGDSGDQNGDSTGVNEQDATKDAGDFFDDAAHQDDDKEKQEKKRKPRKKSETEGVRPKATRAYYAGQLFRERGIKKGFDDEMVAEINKLYGKENDSITKLSLQYAFHALNGYLDELPVDAPEGDE